MVLPIGKPLFCRLAIPVRALGFILGDSPSLGEHLAEIKLSLSVPGLGQGAKNRPGPFIITLVESPLTLRDPCRSIFGDWRTRGLSGGYWNRGCCLR